MDPVVLDEATWRARADAHAARVDAFVTPHLERRSGGVKHPVHDFLFTYYAQRPAQLRRWHPGYGVGLAGGAAYAGLKGYGWFRDGCCATSSTTGTVVEEGALAPVSKPPAAEGDAVAVTTAHVVKQRPLLESLHRLLSATAARPAQLGCFGLHEWAMVYRMTEEQTRHADWPLRLGPDGTDAVAESHRIGCSHFDAFRFFTEPARPLNTLAPTSEDRPAFEQPGCLHAGMDLYKHAFRLTPMISSDLVADCFELARDIRVLDMRAAPYDLADLGFDPVRIETAAGKQEYAAAQRVFAERGAPLRARLVDECARLLAVAGAADHLGERPARQEEVPSHPVGHA
ncbi:3-methyladenine DNA glycosylase [Nocardioides luti]|uniref:3-methyladenine DNA glycosylase n=1 Tax=Nocardioides luti TaxID=2761101 RepID=UPI001FE5BE52|nr:3-methyladenine DNA glycosylase [Nocardioides luti]